MSAEEGPGDLTSLQAYLRATFGGPMGQEGRPKGWEQCLWEPRACLS